MLKKFFSFVAMGLIVFGVVLDAYADRRSYVWTYEYASMPKGSWELENYITTIIPDQKKTNINTIKEWVELEYGITNHWDVAMYQMGKLNNRASGSRFEYDGFKLRTRYRFGERGQFLVDPELYFEYIRDDDTSEPSVIEAKVILAKDIGKWNTSYNQIIKRDLENAGKTEHEYAIGASYEFWPALKLGLESKGSYSNREYALGPTISFAAGRYWVALGAAFGLNKKTDDIQTRMIVGIFF